MQEKKLEVYQAAVKLARSGKERNWKSIQEKLVEAGYHRAPDLLDNTEIRAIFEHLLRARPQISNIANR
jgi:hypothetical protein